MFSQDVLNRLLTYPRIVVGLSGGMDSVVLLHALAMQPGIHGRLSAIHVHHGLSGSADLWQAQCEAICQSLQVKLYVERVRCEPREASARAARYQAFDALLTAGDALVLAHHEQDQAETVLLQLCRGAGVDGLCGMWLERSRGVYTLLRPWLELPRADLLAYAQANHLSWVEDLSNQDLSFSRNHLRHAVLPRLRERWLQVDRRLSSLARHAQQTQSNLHDLALIDYPALADKQPLLLLTELQNLSVARLSNVLWSWLKQQGVAPLTQARIQRVLKELVFSDQGSGLKNIFSNGVLWRYQQGLYWVTGTPEKQVCRDGQFEIRYRRGGERFYWHGQHKCLKKLFQAWKVPPWLRDQIPLVYVKGELVMVKGYAVADGFRSAQDQMEPFFAVEL